MNETKIKKVEKTAESKTGTAILCFFVTIVGELFLLRNVLLGDAGSMTVKMMPELVFLVILAVGIVYCFMHHEGWDNKEKFIPVSVIYILYAIYSVFTYKEFAAAYMTGWDMPYESTAGAMVGVKLVLVLIGITAALPTGPAIDDREYAHRLREKALQQEAQWAKASVVGAKKDLTDTIERLKGSLSEEELRALAKELASMNLDAEGEKEPEKDLAEDWKGWGGGL